MKPATSHLVTLCFGLLLGAGVVASWPALAGQGPTAPPTYAAEVPAARGLDANLYMQIAAEYRACCLQAYNWGTRRLAERLAEHPSSPTGKLAVVLDLDETVFDNAGFQAMMLRSGLAYDSRPWDLWEERGGPQVGLVPGAKEFLLHARAKGVTLVYISNRNQRFHAQCRETLKRMGIDVAKDSDLKLATDTSNKTKRRQETEKEYTVMLYVGDNLRDFDERFRNPVDNTKPDQRTDDPAKLNAAIAHRYAEVDATRDKFGREWIILPNPAYGEWQKVLGLGPKDFDRLAPVGKP